MKYFYFGVWSISCSCLHDTARNETHCGCYFIMVILTEIKFQVIKYHVNNTRNEIIWKETFAICTCENKNDWLLVNGRFISEHSWNEIHFISPAMKSYVNRITFMVGWNFISGIFHFESHVNTLKLIYSCIYSWIVPVIYHFPIFSLLFMPFESCKEYREH